MAMRRGVVVEGRGSQVRVQFEDADGVVSAWLDCAQESTKGKRSFRRFKTGELVRCYLDDDGQTGEALYAIYTDQNPAPADSDELFYEEAADGATLEWGRGSFTYTNPEGTVYTVAGDSVTITGNLSVSANITVNGNLTVNGSTKLRDTTINGIVQSGA